MASRIDRGKFSGDGPVTTSRTGAVGRASQARLNVLFCVLAVCIVGLGVRLVLLVRSDRSRAMRLAEKQQRMVLKVPGRAGSIFARAGAEYVPLAVSKQVPSCYADPALIKSDDLPETARRVAAVLGEDPLDVEAAIMLRRDSRFVWLKRGLTERQAQAIRELRIPAVGITYEWRRSYPVGPTASTVVGFRLRDGSAGGGLELSQDFLLRGRDGVCTVLADARRRPIWTQGSPADPRREGANVYLTLDVVIQDYLHQAVSESIRQFSAQWGAAVVVEPFTGKVLAMCSVPGFDPVAFNKAAPESRTNRAISCPYEPGSVVKPIFAAAAVDAGLLDYSSSIYCEEGLYRASGGGTIRDHGHSYGDLSLADIVVHSSNIGMAKVGEMLGNKRLYAAALRFGLGRKTGIELPGESPGIVRPLDNWNGYSTRRVPFGQEISATTLQLAMAFSVFANGGLLMSPYITDFVTDSSGNILGRRKPRIVRRVLRPEVAAATLQVLHQVVERGTGRACRLSRWSSFGKTGTAQISGPAGYEDGAYVATFVGGAPLGRCRLICVISIYRPDASKGYYGSLVAAPFVRRVLERSLAYLDVPPDKVQLARCP